MTVNPAGSKTFTVYVRIPNRTTSELYIPDTTINGLLSLKVNGRELHPVIEHGYAVIRRTWKKGDKIDLELPMTIQRVRADDKIEADRGHIALRYGPLLYNVETADNQDISKSIGNAPLTLEWKANFLHGVMAIKGRWADGSPLLAVPNYSRLNRVPVAATPDESGHAPAPPVSTVWIKDLP